MKLFVLLSLLFVSHTLASDLSVESVSIKDSGQPEEFDNHSGDYIVELKVKNASDKEVKIQRYSVFTYFKELEKRSGKKDFKGNTDFHKYNSICCHPPTYDSVKSGKHYIIRFRESSKNIGEERFVTIKTESGTIQLAKYVVKITE